MEFEEEQLPRLERLEIARAPGLPKVDLIEIDLAGQKTVPVAVGDADPNSHGLCRRSLTAETP